MKYFEEIDRYRERNCLKCYINSKDHVYRSLAERGVE